jgi:hypothetical protein
MSAEKINPTKIGASFSFCRYGLSVPKAKEALDYYNSNKKTAIEWQSKESTTPIFIDTNVLLKLYKISKDNRSEMLAFLEQNKERIYICGQVGQEYLKHRCAEINHYADTIANLQSEIRSVIEKIKGTQIKNSFDSLLKNDIFQDDMPKSYSMLESIVNTFREAMKPLENSELYTILNDAVKEESETLISEFQYEYNDPILNVIASLKHLEGLSSEEEAYTKRLYDNLLSEYKANNSIEDFSFPGSGDNKKLKLGRPAHGDLIIFHEMLQFTKEADTDSIFVTLDVTKGDWLRRDGTPFIHYIYSIFSLTGHMIYICSEKDFPMSFDSISGEKDKDEHADDDIEEIKDTEISSSPESLNIDQPDSQLPTDIDALQIKTDTTSNVNDIIEDEVEPEAVSVKRYTSSAFRDIDPGAFISELRMALDWAKNYGAGYVNKSLFVYKILRNHHYDSRSAFKVMSQLLSERKIVVRKEIHNNREMDCLDIMTSDLVPRKQ